MIRRKKNGKPWTWFIKRIPIQASVEQVYQAWSTQENLERWFLRKAEFTTIAGNLKQPHETIRPGDSYYWLWHGFPDEVFERRKVLEANGTDMIRFTFTGDCLVTVSMYTERNATICELAQENIPIDSNPESNLYVNCITGWTFYLTNLKSVLEGGPDLRNHDPRTKDVINA